MEKCGRGMSRVVVLCCVRAKKDGGDDDDRQRCVLRDTE